MLGDMGLNKNRCDLWVKPHSKQHGGKFNRVLAKYAWLVGDGERVQVDNAVENVVGMLP